MATGYTAFEEHGKLRVEGRNLVDKNGEVIQLKGVSTHGISLYPNHVNIDSYNTFKRDWKANLIRLAMYTDEELGFCTDGDKEDIKKIMHRGVKATTDLGMYAIIDWHILKDNSPMQNKEAAIKFFDEMASIYKDQDNIIYEICNEPNGDDVTWDIVKEYAEEVIPVIRKHDKDAVILVGTPCWSQDVDIAYDNPLVGFENIMYVLHFYAATHKDELRDKLVSVLEKEFPVFISEFSICDASGNGIVDYDEAEKWFDLINKYQLSYAAWNVSNKDESSALILPTCNKYSDWLEEEYSDTARWIKKEMRK